MMLSADRLTTRSIATDQDTVPNLFLHPTQDQFLSAGEKGTVKRWDMQGKRKKK
jgi:WD40 repeat protein